MVCPTREEGAISIHTQAHLQPLNHRHANEVQQWRGATVSVHNGGDAEDGGGPQWLLCATNTHDQQHNKSSPNHMGGSQLGEEKGTTAPHDVELCLPSCG